MLGKTKKNNNKENLPVGHRIGYCRDMEVVVPDMAAVVEPPAAELEYLAEVGLVVIETEFAVVVAFAWFAHSRVHQQQFEHLAVAAVAVSFAAGRAAAGQHWSAAVADSDLPSASGAFAVAVQRID